MSEINMPCGAGGVSSGQHQLTRQFERMLACAFEHESPGVSKHRRIKAGRDLRRNFYVSLLGKTINHFGRGHRFRIDPVHLRKRATALVVVNVDQELVLESLQTGTLNAIAFKKDG